MIIQPEKYTIDGITINELTNSNPYYYCAYDNDNNIVTVMDIAVKGVTGTMSNIFGSETIEELEEEIERLGLKTI